MKDRLNNVVLHAPAMQTINAAANRISEHKHVLSYGVWVFGGFALALLTTNAFSLAALFTGFAALLGTVYYRWSLASKRIADARIGNRVLADRTDIAWLEWARDFEPEIDALLRRRCANNQPTFHDFQAAYALYAWYRIDLPARAPWHGDVEACHADQEVRRERLRGSKH